MDIVLKGALRREDLLFEVLCIVHVVSFTETLNRGSISDRAVKELVGQDFTKAGENLCHIHSLFNIKGLREVIDHFNSLILTKNKKVRNLVLGQIIELSDIRNDGLSRELFIIFWLSGAFWLWSRFILSKRELSVSFTDVQLKVLNLELIISANEDNLVSEIVIDHPHDTVVLKDTGVFLLKERWHHLHSTTVGVILILRNSGSHILSGDLYESDTVVLGHYQIVVKIAHVNFYIIKHH